MTRTIDFDAAENIQLNEDSFDVACQAGNEAARAAVGPQEELAICIRAYLQAERERLGNGVTNLPGGQSTAAL